MQKLLHFAEMNWLFIQVTTTRHYRFSLGGKGIISVIANICPQLSHDICAKYFAGDIAESRKLFLEHLELMDAMFMDVNPIVIKEAANLMGFDCGSCRMPLLRHDRTRPRKTGSHYEKIPFNLNKNIRRMETRCIQTAPLK